MARPLRIEYEGAVYHVTARGNEQRPLFVDDGDRGRFLRAAGRMLYVDNRTNNGQHKYAYTYDYVGNRATMMVTTGGGSKTHVYSYDATYQLTHVDYPPELSYLATDTTFDYDAAGNRTSVIDGSGTTPYSTNNLNQYTSADGTSFQYDASGNMTHDATYAYGYDPENRLVKVHKSGSLPPLTLAQALDLPLVYTTGGSQNWTAVNSMDAHTGDSCAVGDDLGGGQQSWLQTTVEGSGTFSFWWKTYSQEDDGNNMLEFRIDGVVQQGTLHGTHASWEQKTCTLGSGTHTLRWTYTRDSMEYEGRGWVDGLTWSGSCPPAPEPDPAAWLTLLYHYDAAGRRVEKKYDSSVVTKYVYDGDSCLAEYDVSGNLRRKYIYGPGVDQPVCMIEAAGSYAGTYYYHFDALGNVVALTSGNVDHMGETVQVYDYDVYGRVGATDASHPNRFMFTGREFDKETGLYYYRARYYKPEIGRFLQPDKVGYGAGMNLYRYCKNNPWNMTDPSGNDPCDPCDPCAPCVDAGDPGGPGSSPPNPPGSSPPTGDPSGGASGTGRGPRERLTQCPPFESGAWAKRGEWDKGGGGMCKDTKGGQSFHPETETCYREMVPEKFSGDDGGYHCCYFTNGQLDTKESHRDKSQVATKTTGDGETCNYLADPGRVIEHAVFDVILPIPCKFIEDLIRGGKK